ncbi:MAG: RnfABCDGE type electron transport complex subunit D [Nevskiaceae bacterium]|jgi:Na+-translocating ferredoxin:NAD+ oxidoreductase RnfD subunit|nr:RnfABCDGE type electron transport complex subunit D [Nevskiaceae bacterium]
MRKLIRFFKTPKGLLTLLLLMLTFIAAPGEGVGVVALNMGASVLAAGIVDLIILRLRNGGWEYPGGAVLTAMIVVMVMRSQEPWAVPVVTSVVAVLSKYLLRTRQANVLNPAAFGLVLMFYLMPHGQSWWGALPEVSPPWLRVVLLAGGFYLANRVNKLPLVLSFLGAHFCLFTLTAFLGDARHVAEIFRSPDVDAALYFALVILTDPPTSPAKYAGQWIFGIIAAACSYAVFMVFGVAYFLLAGVLAGNAWEAWRRVQRRSQEPFARKMLAFARELGPLRG